MAFAVKGLKRCRGFSGVRASFLTGISTVAITQAKMYPVEKNGIAGSRPFLEVQPLVERLLSVQHRLNPLHVYCRFLEIGLSRRISTTLCKSYERVFFCWISSTIRIAVHLCCLLNPRTRVEEVIRKL
jgi:hypothetical protein